MAIKILGALLRQVSFFQSWQFLAGCAGFWVAEVTLQSVWLMAAGEEPASSSMLVLPAALVIFFALIAGASYAHTHHATQRAVAHRTGPAEPRLEVARIRAELADLGQQRLNSLIGEVEFHARRDDILRPVTHLARP